VIAPTLAHFTSLFAGQRTLVIGEAILDSYLRLGARPTPP
jgi:hypothetical protein